MNQKEVSTTICHFLFHNTHEYRPSFLPDLDLELFVSDPNPGNRFRVQPDPDPQHWLKDNYVGFFYNKNF